MCFTNTRNLKSPKVAKTDIICFKKMKRLRSNRVKSEYYNDILQNEWTVPVSYKIGETYRATDFNGNSITRLELKYNDIDRGFHSYKERIQKRFYLKDNIIANVKCVIPKGTQYYENNKDYVSTDIKFVKIYKAK
jgi:hypothetical protein